MPVLPEAISFDQAAAMMLQGMTAQVLIRQVYPVKAGDLILVHAAAGGTGLRNSPRPRLQLHDPVYETEFRRGSVPYLRWRETAGGLRFCRQGYIPALARLSKTARIGGHVWASLRSHRSHCARGCCRRRVRCF